jgi:hypothetical protein
MILRWHLIRFALILAADVAALTALFPSSRSLAVHGSNINAWVELAGADQVAATFAAAALWLCAAWLGIGFSALLLATAPGVIGSAGRRLFRLVVPVAVRRLLLATVGLSIGLAVLAPVASAATTSAPTWPIGNVDHGTVSHSDQPARPLQPIWPTDPAQITSIPVTSVPTTRTPVDTGAVTTRHTVAPNDTLWELAAAQLDGPSTITSTAARPANATIAAPSPQRIRTQVQLWYSANRTVIGSDPSLLRPGQQLVEPSVAPPP